VLTPGDLEQIAQWLTRIEVQGARYTPAAEAMTGL
jgi:hypothetical protein